MDTLRGPHSLVPLTPPHADSSTLELGDQRTSRCYFELFAAAVGDLEWLRFCLNRNRGDIATDNKVRPWSVGAGTEVPSFHLPFCKELLT